jgi:hypothetical protein
MGAGGGATNASRTTSSKELKFRLGGQQKLTYTYLVSMTGNSGWMEFDLWSKNGGTDKKKIDISIR